MRSTIKRKKLYRANLRRDEHEMWILRMIHKRHIREAMPSGGVRNAEQISACQGKWEVQVKHGKTPNLFPNLRVVHLTP